MSTQRIRNLPAKVLLLAIVALAFGGMGGSFQVSRLCLLALLPVLMVRLPCVPRLHLRQYSAPLILFSFMLLLLGVITLMWSVSKFVSIGYLITLTINLLPLAMVALMSDNERNYLQARMPKAWLLAAGAALPLALYELFTGNHFALGLKERGGGAFSVLPYASGLHGNFNDFSLFLVLCLFGICHLDPRSSSLRWRCAAFVVGLSAVLVVFMNMSRGAILTVVLLLFARFYRSIISKRGLITFAFGSFLIGLSVETVRDEKNLLVQYLILKFSDFSSDLEHDGGRLAITSAGVDGIVTTLGLGVGAGASSVYLASQPSVLIPNPHNLILEWGLNFGVLGLMMLGFFLVCTWSVASRNRSCSRRVVYAFILLMPLYGVIQSHLTGYTYFWLAFATTAVFSYPRQTLVPIKLLMLNPRICR